MAIPYKSSPLPSVSTFPFNISRWGGVNKIKGAISDFEMQNCKNMGSNNYPYASPRSAREKIIDEQGIKRIYKVEGEKVYCIDNENYLCFFENGVKSYVTYTENETETKIQMPDCTCTNNYDKGSIFYPNVRYMDEENKLSSPKYPIDFGEITYLKYENLHNYTRYGLELKTQLPVYNINATTFKISVKFPDEDDLEAPLTYFYHDYLEIKVEATDKDGNTQKNYLGWDMLKDKRSKTWTVTFDSFKKGSSLNIYDKYSGIESDDINEYIEAIPRLNFIKSGEWYIEAVAENGESKGNPCVSPLSYGVVYNNRIVGVSGSDIRASALGDFTNFWEFVDEAGNPSATGAYATDVGSYGDFTGICAYNNVLLLFKRDIVYEMYGSMPYTLTELCRTGCIDNDSIVHIDGVLYWASPKGIVRYSGGVPTVISTQVDIKTNKCAKAGTDGRRYYIFDGERTFVYDTYLNMWHIEDELKIKMFFGFENQLYFVSDNGIYKINSGTEKVDWEFETKDFSFESETRKNLSRLFVRADMPPGSRLEIFARQDGGKWQRVATKTAEKDEMFDFKLKVKKCDSFALKFKGKGDVKILDIHGKVTVGTSKHRSGASLNVYR